MRQASQIMQLVSSCRNKCRQWIMIGRVTALSTFTIMRAQQWRSCGSSTPVFASKQLQQLMYLVATGEVFGEEVSWVDLPPYLPQ